MGKHQPLTGSTGRNWKGGRNLCTAPAACCPLQRAQKAFLVRAAVNHKLIHNQELSWDMPSCSRQQEWGVMLVGMGCDTSALLHAVMAKVLFHHTHISPSAGTVSGVPGFMQGDEAMGKQSHKEAASLPSKAMVS